MTIKGHEMTYLETIKTSFNADIEEKYEKINKNHVLCYFRYHYFVEQTPITELIVCKRHAPVLGREGRKIDRKMFSIVNKTYFYLLQMMEPEQFMW